MSRGHLAVTGSMSYSRVTVFKVKQTQQFFPSISLLGDPIDGTVYKVGAAEPPVLRETVGVAMVDPGTRASPLSTRYRLWPPCWVLEALSPPGNGTAALLSNPLNMICMAHRTPLSSSGALTPQVPQRPQSICKRTEAGRRRCCNR